MDHVDDQAVSPPATHAHMAMPSVEASSASVIENRTFAELAIGDSASIAHRVTEADIQLFAIVSGDVNPAHVDPAYARTDAFHHVVAHGMFGGALISSVLGTRLPGPGTIYLSQFLRFHRPVGIGDTITARVTVRQKKPEHGDVMLDCACTNQDGVTVITGIAEVRAPREKLRLPRVALPTVSLEPPPPAVASNSLIAREPS